MSDDNVIVGFQAEGTEKAAADVGKFDAAITKTDQSTQRLDKSLKKTSSGVSAVGKSLKAAVTPAKILARSLEQAARAKALNQIAKDAARVAVETKDAAQAAQLLEKSLISIGASDKEIEQVVKQVERLRDAAEQSGEAMERFDKVSKDVSLAGDVESQTRTIGGGIGALGGESGRQIEGVISAGSEIPAAIEALPKLKESAKGLPKAAAAAATSLGPVGIGLAAVAIVAAGVFIFAAKGIKKAAEETRKTLEAFATANETFVRQGVEGLIAQVEELAVSSEIAAGNIEEATKTIAEVDAGIQFSDLADVLVTTEEDAAKKIRKANQETLDQNDRVVKQAFERLQAEGLLSEEIDTAALSTEEMTAQIVALGDSQGTTTDEILAGAEAEATRVRFIQEASTLGVEATKERLEGLKLEQAAIQAQLNSLNALEDKPQEVTDQITALEGSMSMLGEQTQILAGNLDSGAAAAIDAAEKQKEAAEEAAQAQEQAAEKIIAANQKYADAIENIATATGRAISDARRKSAQAAAKLGQKQIENEAKAIEANNKKRADIIKKGAGAEIKAAAKIQSELKKIRDTGDKAISKAGRARDFIALADAIEAKDTQLKEAIAASEEQRTERVNASKQALADQKEDAGVAKRQRAKDAVSARRDLQQAASQQLSDIRRAEGRKIADARKAKVKELAAITEGEEKKLDIIEDFAGRTAAVLSGMLRGSGSLGALGGSSPFSQTTNSGGNTLNQSNTFSGQINPQQFAELTLSAMKAQEGG